MYKVQKHITECQNEVKSNIFHEAFSLIHDTAFHHPHDHSTIEYKDEHDWARHNFTLTEQEILKFFENHDHHLKGSGDHSETIHDDLHHSHHSIDDHAHIIDEHSPHEHTLSEHNLHQPHSSHTIEHYPHGHFHEWHKSHLANSYKKTDAVQQTDKQAEEQRLLDTITAKRSPYIYFDMKTDATETDHQQQQTPSRRSDFHSDIHSDTHHHTDAHHHIDIHPTTATFKDKRIAGVSVLLISGAHCSLFKIQIFVTLNLFSAMCCVNSLV